MKLGYDWLVEGEAYRYLVSLPKRKRLLLERAFDSLASRPFQPTLYTEQGPDGSRLDSITASGHIVTYHVDHAIRRIWVTDIYKIP
ncbi:MAG: hypothetical protein V4773_17300 [Verrucomicrobiota bacterium]